MHQRPIVGGSKTGSISRLQARSAAKAVKMAKLTGTAPRGSASSKGGQFVSASTIERYVGHFGVVPSTNGRGNGSGVKKRSAAKKTVSK
jgi:hypothetical protein